MKYITKIFILCIALLTLIGCFKEEKQGTSLQIALYSQNVPKDPILKTTHDIEAYAFHVDKGTKWEVTTWEDALNHVITNKERANMQLSTPEVIGTYDPEAEYQITLELWSQFTFLVVVDKTNRIYATRLYETPVNYPVMPIQLHLYAHKKSGPTNGWDMVNPFPDEVREPLVPNEDNKEERENIDNKQ
jgi:hypothetical protein